ncbi:serine/threonine-protein kinase mTOR [Neocloeon triangulifer]|uniref:serine/threonine-protein kinase mTOR n=1 Tax=Neocloeon triangulifer TaxID=2078957 RepID=UPI00286F67F1|nr:serine/threonine-protein kinase mTOR [Neocloeon triangulifer]
MSSPVMMQIVNGLKSRNPETRAKSAKELHHYVTTELREVSVEEWTAFMDEFNKHIHEMVNSKDTHEKLGGISAMICLIKGDVGKINTRISRFANYLRNLLPCTDINVMHMAVKTMGQVALVSGTSTTEYFEFEIKRAFEWLAGDRNEHKRLAAVLVLRELAVSMPTFFYQQVQQFFDLIFNGVRDPYKTIREGAVEAIRAALVVTAQRETAKQAQKPLWYKQCYEEVKTGFEEASTKGRSGGGEERIHGSLLVINELMRCGHTEWEKQYEGLKDRIKFKLPSPQTDAELLGFGLRVRPTPTAKSPANSQQNCHRLMGLSESAACRQLIGENFDEICLQALYHRSSRSPHIQSALLNLLPRLAAFNKAKFSKDHLAVTMHHLLFSLRSRDKDRALAFTTIGLIAVAVETDILPYLPKVMEVIKSALPAKEGKKRSSTTDTPVLTKRRSTQEPSVLFCVTLLGVALRTGLEAEIRDILEQILATGLSSALTTALQELATAIPSLRRDISDGLLRMLSLVLMNQPLRYGSLSRHSSHSPPPISQDATDTESTILALRTLGSFNFDGHSLLQFVRRCADHYLTSDNTQIRLESVRTCSRLLCLALEGPQMHALETTVADVLGKLLVVGITDSDAEVRFCVLESMDEAFDMHLAQAENLSALFIALNDEAFEVRELAMCLVGRLSNMNPAYVKPSLRMTLVHLLTELKHSGLGRNKEQAARMLSLLVNSAPRLVRPYMECILNVLVPKLREPEQNPGVLLAVLACIGYLAEVGGSELVAWLPEMLSLLLEMLGDGSSTEKRSVSLWVLGQLVEATGYVIRPYSEYPILLDTLLSFLKTEQNPAIRRETLRVLGLLGALDPYKHKMNLGQIDAQSDAAVLLSITDQSEAESSQDLSTSEMLVNMSSATLEEYYPAIAISTLMRIIRDPTLAQHHTMVVQAVTFIFKSLGIKCVPYIAQVMPSLLHVVRVAEANFREFLFQQLAQLIAIVKQHIRPYLDNIFELIKEFWMVSTNLQCTLILLIEHIAVALGSEFKVYLPQLIPQILRVLTHDNSKDRQVTLKLLIALQKFGGTLDEHIHLVLPPVVRLFDSTDCPIAVCKTALETVDVLSDSLNFSDLASRIIHPLVRVLDNYPELRPYAMETLCALVTQLGKKYTIFIPLVHRTLAKHKIAHQKYEVLACRVISNSSSAEEEEFFHSKSGLSRSKNRESDLSSMDTTTIKKLSMSAAGAAKLQRAWASTRRVSKDDWIEWLRRLSIEFLKESPSPVMKSCWVLAQTYSQLPRDLFNAAFVSCWTQLTQSQQDELIQSLQQALLVPDLPEVTQTILNLAEFMEHCDKGPLPIKSHILGERAMLCRAYAKALHYKEEEFHNGPNSQVFESLISINNKLQQKEAAAGLLEYVITHKAGADVKIQERWHEKLHNWEKALHMYEEKLKEKSDDLEYSLGQMRCLEALGEWGQLHEVASSQWGNVEDMGKQKMARMASAAAWGLGQWESMDQYVACIPRDTLDGAFYRAVLAVHRGQYTSAQLLIDSARDLMDTELTAMAGESYQRAYGAMVSLQMLAELEEVVLYKLIPEKRSSIRKMWWDRLQGCQRVVEDWQKIIQVHSLVVTPHEDVYTWLKYASLCRKSGRLMLSHKTLTLLLGTDPSLQPDQPLPANHPQVTFAYTKHMWMSGKKEEAFNQLHRFVQSTLNPLSTQIIVQDDAKMQDRRRRLLARCYLKLGEWQESIQGINEESIPAVLQYYAAATDHDGGWYKAWHAWAYMNFETVLFYKQQQQTVVGEGPPPKPIMSSEALMDITKNAVQGFFRSISLSHGSSLQDTLRLLTLWFDYGQWPPVYEALVEGLRTIEIDTWLQVIPQLIARIDTPRAQVGRLIHHLLMDIGKHHPQALVYPLTVACKSASTARRNAANKLLKNMCEHSPGLVQQAVMVSDELIRVAILWHELWHEGLEEASRLYFGERNVKGMFEKLEPLHAMIQKGPQTLKETSFNQAYGRDLQDAQEWCGRYKVSGNVRDLNQAWDLYYHVFRRISRQLPQLTSLELHYVSPKLLLCQDLELAVPGSYSPNQPPVRIACIKSSLQVITSKQRPRKLTIKGSNGKEYMFLLKGHEDLRQDERVMQLFGLVNTLLINDPDTFRRNLTIQRYAVIPLSTNSGLIGWVPHCDTLHTLIRDYREKKKILLNIEHRIMLRMAPDYDHLTLMQKVEVFEHALVSTQGDDLARLLWLKSPSSEVWFDRRTNYTRSLAVMSMVGYILGLGDRHPSNLMLDRLSGKILHIDFGDCFEVAMTREKFPEKIPFRLTRMLINAMEVTGIEGTYRRTCESVLNVLRRNKDSLMAVLEAFVYDPLLNWRLMDSATTKTKTTRPKTGEPSDMMPSSQETADLMEEAAVSLGVSQSNAKKNMTGSLDNGEEGAQNKKALQIITRVRDKLTGRDFSHESEVLTVQQQVDLLVQQATSNENLCQCYIGWCPFW